MVKQLALSLWFVSAILLPDVMAQEITNTDKYLTDEELRNPEFVSNWLKTKGVTADKKDAERFLNYGLSAKKNPNWSGAAKTFGESMIRYPSPQALTEYADANLIMLGIVRAREKSVKQKMASDMKHALDFYKSALAADAVLDSLPKSEKERVRNNVDCLEVYLRSAEVQRNCEPLQNYTMHR